MVNQLAKISQNIVKKSKPLRDLLKKQNAWSWGPMQESAFDAKSRKSAPTLNLPIIIPIGKSWSQLIVRRLDLAVCFCKSMVTFGNR